MLCLKCYAERTVNAEGFWITHESQVTVDAVRKAPHLITELIDGLFEIPNTDITVDSMDGAEVVGSMDTIGTFDDVVSKVRRNVADALKTYRRVGLTMPGIYQFAVDLTLVTREEFAR